jgi:hypothetical protein
MVCWLWIIFFYLGCEAIDTAATPGLLCHPRVIVKMIVVKQMECRLAGETEVLGKNLPQRHFCPSQNPTLRDPGFWTRAAALGSRRLTAWAMARPLTLQLVWQNSFLNAISMIFTTWHEDWHNISILSRLQFLAPIFRLEMTLYKYCVRFWWIAEELRS